MSDTGVSARKSAVFLLDEILGEGKLMSELLGAGVLDRLPPDEIENVSRWITTVVGAAVLPGTLMTRCPRKQTAKDMHK